MYHAYSRDTARIEAEMAPTHMELTWSWSYVIFTITLVLEFLGSCLFPFLWNPNLFPEGGRISVVYGPQIASRQFFQDFTFKCGD